MNKKIFSLALAAVVVLGSSFSAMAGKPKKEKIESCQAQTECTAAQAQECGCPDGKGQRPDPFSGLNLTADQQAKLEALKQEVRKERQVATQRMRQAADSIRQEGKRAKREGRHEAVEAGQQLKRGERGAQMATERGRQWLAKVKEILTPEQYVQYLENSYVQQTSRPGKKGPEKRHHDGRGHGPQGQAAPAPQCERK